MHYRMGIDVGGTFTDLVIVNEDGKISYNKAASTPEDFSNGVISVLKAEASARNISLRQLLGETDLICHGITIATNTLLQRKGSRVGFITTKGHREMFSNRGMIPQKYRYDLGQALPEELVPRYLRLTVPERCDMDGHVITPLDEDSVREVLRKFREYGVESIAVCFLWSIVNPSHEERVRLIANEEDPEQFVTLSSEIESRPGEYKRSLTTVVNSYVGPEMSRYVGELERKLVDNGYNSPLLVVQSSGGMMTPTFSKRFPVHTLLSGPAAGPAAAALMCEAFDSNNLIAIDMGGTSFDVSLIKNGRVTTTRDTEVVELELALRMVDIITLGAGGGSIAKIDSIKRLQVGPESMGGAPGPACYGMGGTSPTVTDADLVLGYINPDYFLGGRMKMNTALARQVLQQLGDEAGMDLLEMAEGVYRVVNNKMSAGISAVSTQRGEDPRDYDLIVFGGAGPVHAARLAEELEIKRVFIPKMSSVFCAMGMPFLNIMHETSCVFFANLDEVDPKLWEEAYQNLEKEGAEILKTEGIPPEERYYIRSADMRYHLQVHEIEVEFPGRVNRETIKEQAERFHDKHESLYAYRSQEDSIQTTALRVMACAKGRPFYLKEQEYGGQDPSSALKTRRNSFFSEYRGFRETATYDGDKMLCGYTINGPAIVEEKATTIVVPPAWQLVVDKWLNYIMTRGGEKN